MAVVGQWNGRKFVVSPKLIRGFKDLTVKGSCETDDKNSDKQYYVQFKKKKGVEVSLSVVLTAALGCDVRAEAMKLIQDARAGASDYFYVGQSKLTPCKLMLTQADVSEVTMLGGKSAGEVWKTAVVKLTMKQATKDDVEEVPKKSSSSSKKKKKKTSSGSSSSVKKEVNYTHTITTAAKKTASTCGKITVSTTPIYQSLWRDNH